MLYSRALERDKTYITKERDASLANQRALEADLLRYQVQESELRSQLKDKQMTEDRINSNRTRLTGLHNQLKVRFIWKFFFFLFCTAAEAHFYIRIGIGCPDDGRQHSYPGSRRRAAAVPVDM